MVDAQTMVNAFSGAGYRLTAPRVALAELIAGQTGHFTAEGLLAESQRRRLGLGRATIFRSLDVLAGLGLVERLDLPSGEHAFVACEPVHHHHIVCSICGRAEEVGDYGMRALAPAVERSTGFSVDTHRLELYGTCLDCQRRRPS